MVLTAEIHLPPGPFFVLIMPNCPAFHAEIRNHSAILYATDKHIFIALQQIFRSIEPIPAVWGVPPYKFCENLHGPPRRSAGEKVLEIDPAPPYQSALTEKQGCKLY